MDYILKEHFLPFGDPYPPNLQYQHWLEKRKIEKEKAQLQHFKKLWTQIDEEERQKQKHKHSISKRSQMQGSNVNQSSAQPEVTYVKNMLWKQNVQVKLEKIRKEKEEQNLKEQIRQITVKPKEKTMFKEPAHQGPIKAWQQRFQNYLKNKQGENEDSTQTPFHPVINEHSRRLTINMDQKVENRLINYGEKLKQKKAQMSAEFDKDLFQCRNRGYTTSVASDASDTFFRLYKEGQKFNKKRNEQRSQFSFTPQINQTSLSLVSKISHKRKPLYESKISQNQVNQQKSTQKPFKKNKQIKQQGFINFLKRNEALLSKQQLNKFKREEEIKEKQNKEAKLCTFAPEINKNSQKIIANRPSEATQRSQNITSNIDSYKQISNDIIPQLFGNNNSSSELSCKACLQKNVKPSQRIYRLNSEGSLIPQVQMLGISELEEISHDLQCTYEQKELSSEKGSTWKRQMNLSRQMQSSLFATDRFNQKSAVIAEQIEEDSIEKQKNDIWENELEMMEQQIEEMMKRTNL